MIGPLWQKSVPRVELLPRQGLAAISSVQVCECGSSCNNNAVVSESVPLTLTELVSLEQAPASSVAFFGDGLGQFNLARQALNLKQAFNFGVSKALFNQ